jgi:hypothetical protein
MPREGQILAWRIVSMWRVIKHFRFSMAELLIGSALLSLSCAALVKANYEVAVLASGFLFLSALAAAAVLSTWKPESRAFCISFLVAAGLHQYVCTPANWRAPFADTGPFPTMWLLDKLWQAMHTEHTLTLAQFGGAGGAGPRFSVVTPELHLFVHVGVSVISFWCGILTGLLARALARAGREEPARKNTS